MYTISSRKFGLHLRFSGSMDHGELERWLEESREVLSRIQSPFHVFVDMRGLAPLGPDAQPVMDQGQRLYRKRGMHRSVVILDNPVTRLQFQRIAAQSGILENERYLDATMEDWERTALDWLERGMDPTPATPRMHRHTTGGVK